MTRSPVSSFTRAALVATALAAAGCDTTAGPGAHVDLEALAQAQAPMEQLMALTDMTVFQVEEGMRLAATDPAPDTNPGAVVVTAFGEEGGAVFVPSGNLNLDPTRGAEPPEGEPDDGPAREDDEEEENAMPPRPFRLLWSNFTSGGLGLNGDLELAAGGVATADVTIEMGGATAWLAMEGTWTQDGGGADVTMTGTMDDSHGLTWTVQTDALRLETGCAVASGGRWLAEAASRDGSTNPLRFEVRYQEGCGGCSDLLINGTPMGRSCVGGN